MGYQLEVPGLIHASGSLMPSLLCQASYYRNFNNKIHHIEIEQLFELTSRNRRSQSSQIITAAYRATLKF